MKKSVLNLFFTLLTVSVVSAQNISIDQTFGNNGILKQSFGLGTGVSSDNDYAYDMVVLPDNKAFVCGTTHSACSLEDFAVIKLLENGELDKSFNGNGISILSLTAGEDWAYSMAMQSDGKIVIGGTIKQGLNLDFAVARMNADGSIDETFNNTGFAIADIGGYDWAKKVAVWNDKIIIGGYSIASGDTSYAVARFNSDGSPDVTFNGTGMKRFTEPGREMLEAMDIDASGNVFMAGYQTTATSFDMYLVKISPDGSYDAAFDGDGKKNIAISNYMNGFNSVYIQDNGKIVLGGSAFDKVTTYYIEQHSYILMLNEDGTPDTSFDGDGMFQKNDLTGVPVKITADANGNILAVSDYGIDGMELFKISADGIPDTNFGTNGMLHVLMDNYKYVKSVCLDAEGRLTAAVFPYGSGFMTVRCLEDGALDNTYGKSGVAMHKTSTSSETIISAQYTQSNSILITGAFNESWITPVLSRLTFNGELDNTFAEGAGSEIYPLQEYASPSDVLELPDKSFVLLTDNKVVKLTESGALETMFNTTGFVLIDFQEPNGYLTQMLKTSSGDILVIGITSAADYSAASKKIFLAKLLSDGSYDTNFGTAGKVKIVLSDYLPGKIINNGTLKMTLLPDGKILVATGIDGALLFRLDANGTIDNTFGSNGFYSSADNTFHLQNVAVQNDGNIILAGYGDQDNLAVQRLYENGTQMDQTFAGTGMFSIADFYLSTATKVYANNEHILIVGYASDEDYNTSHLIVQLNMDGSEASDFNAGTYYIRPLEAGSFYNAVVTKSADGKLLLINDFKCRYTAVQYLTNQVDQEPVATSVISPGASVQENNLILFPNPANHNFKINLANSNETEGDLSVIHASGYEVKHINTYNFSQVVVINDLKPGLYVVQLKTRSGGIHTEKLIVY